MTEAQAAEQRADAMQVVMIGLGEEKFALDAGLVREIIDPVPVTKVAGARAFVPSVINVRGNVIPLADLRIREIGLRKAIGANPAAMMPRAPAAMKARTATPSPPA